MAVISAPNGGIASNPPSVSTLKAARATASSPHALINLSRLIKSLDGRIPSSDPDDSPLVELSGVSTVQRRKDWESLLYARAALDILKESNEGSSTSGRTIDDLTRSVNGIIARYEAIVGLTLAPGSSRPATPLSKTLAAGSGNSRIPTPEHLPQAPAGPLRTEPPLATASKVPSANGTASVRRRRPAPALSEYLSKREKEDAQGGEAGLLPLGPEGQSRVVGGSSKSQRDQLLAGQRSDGVVGNSQLHEELGGQLAEMSHRLKLNAIHFSNSLEAEKSLLESSQQTLESNLVATQASKKHLGTVSSKGRGTTCLTLGVVLLVLIIFVWTYMLIRFT